MREETEVRYQNKLGIIQIKVCLDDYIMMKLCMTFIPKENYIHNLLNILETKLDFEKRVEDSDLMLQIILKITFI